MWEKAFSATLGVAAPKTSGLFREGLRGPNPPEKPVPRSSGLSAREAGFSVPDLSPEEGARGGRSYVEDGRGGVLSVCPHADSDASGRVGLDLSCGQVRPQASGSCGRVLPKDPGATNSSSSPPSGGSFGPDGSRIIWAGQGRDGMCGWCAGRHGWQPVRVDDVQEVLASPYDWMSEVRAREAAVFPGSE